MSELFRTRRLAAELVPTVVSILLLLLPAAAAQVQVSRMGKANPLAAVGRMDGMTPADLDGDGELDLFGASRI